MSCLRKGKYCPLFINQNKKCLDPLRAKKTFMRMKMGQTVQYRNISDRKKVIFSFNDYNCHNIYREPLI